MNFRTFIDVDFTAFLRASFWALGVSIAFARREREQGSGWRILGYAWSLLGAAAILALIQVDEEVSAWFGVLEAAVRGLGCSGVFLSAVVFLRRANFSKTGYVMIAAFGVISIAGIGLGEAGQGRLDAARLAAFLSLGLSFYLTPGTERGRRWPDLVASFGMIGFGLVSMHGALLRAGVLPDLLPQLRLGEIERVVEFAFLGAAFAALEFLNGKGRKRDPKKGKSSGHVFQASGRMGLVLVLIVVAGIAAKNLGDRFEASRKAQIMTRARLAAGAVPPALPGKLEWSDKDLDNPSYQQLKHLMTSLVQSDKDLRFVLLAGLREGKSYFLVDSESPASKDYSPPGQLYEEADASYLQGMASRAPFLLGPVTDHWGTWMIASVPLSTAGGVGINAELDIAASDWIGAIRAARLPAFLLGFLLIIVALIVFHARRRIKDSLAAVMLSQEEKNTIIEGSPDAVLMIGIDRKIITANHIAWRAFGISLTEMRGRFFEDIWPVAMRGRVFEAAENSLAGNPTEVEVEFQTAGKENRVWRIATNPIHDLQGLATGFVVVGADISERKRAEHLLREAKESAELATKAKSEFLAVMSHEIRTPLGAVIGLLELLRGDPGADARKRYTSLARHSAKSLLQILDDILDVAKVESGKITLESTPFALREELLHVLEAMRVRAENKHLRLEWIFDDGLPSFAMGDPTRIKQILANLINNAVKFTAKGAVTIQVKAIWQEAGRFMLDLQVSDTGIGMSPEVLSRLFSKFEQADASTTRQFGGTGLGLAIVKGLVECMDGKVSVRSEFGSGTTFQVNIPLIVGADTGREYDRDTAAPWAGTVPRLRLLCVDDDTINQEYIGETLRVLGHEVSFAMNGLEALRQLADDHFDAVLMDNRMPVMDGFQATRAIRRGEAGEQNATMYIIAITANASLAYRDECIAAGMNDYLAKPMSHGDLDAALLRAAQHRGITGPPASANTVSTPIGLSAQELLASVGLTEAVVPASDLPEPSRAMVVAYLRETPRRLTEMREGFDHGDFATLSRAAHTLKGNSRYVAADHIAILAAQVQDLADLAETGQLASLIEAITNEFERIKPGLETRLKQNGA